MNPLGRNRSSAEKKSGFEPGRNKAVSNEIRMSSRDMGKADWKNSVSVWMHGQEKKIENMMIPFPEM